MLPRYAYKISNSNEDEMCNMEGLLNEKYYTLQIHDRKTTWLITMVLLHFRAIRKIEGESGEMDVGFPEVELGWE